MTWWMLLIIACIVVPLVAGRVIHFGSEGEG